MCFNQVFYMLTSIFCEGLLRLMVHFLFSYTKLLALEERTKFRVQNLLFSFHPCCLYSLFVSFPPPVNKGVMWSKVWPGTLELRRSCTWLWWLVGIVWTKPLLWSNLYSSSVSRRSSFTFLPRILWPHSLKKGYEALFAHHIIDLSLKMTGLFGVYTLFEWI